MLEEKIKSQFCFLIHYNKIGGTGIRTQDNGFANRGLSPLGDAAALLKIHDTIKEKVRQEVFSYPHICLNLRSGISKRLCRDVNLASLHLFVNEIPEH